MALMTHQMQSPSVVFPSSTLAWSERMKISQHRTMLQMLSSGHLFMTSKQFVSLRLRVPGIQQNIRAKSLRIFSFKGSAKNYESGDELRNSKPTNNSVGTSYLPQDGEEYVSNSPKLQDVTTHNLFTKWLSLLRMQPLAQVGDGIIEGPDQGVVLPAHNDIHTKESGNVVKMVLCYFLGLDLTVKVPLLIFFRQTVKVLKNVPVYCQYVAVGKLKEDIRSRLWQPIVDIKNLDYKTVLLQKRKEFREWIVEKYLDYVESIWPFYCRTIRFLKRANFI